MNLFKRIHALAETNREATARNQELMAHADRESEATSTQKAVALESLERATAQAAILAAGDRRNHYSESLTHAFRGGRTA